MTTKAELCAQVADVEPHLRTAAEKEELFPRLEVLADCLFQTQTYIFAALLRAGLTVVPLDPAAREISPEYAAAAPPPGPGGLVEDADRLRRAAPALADALEPFISKGYEPPAGATTITLTLTMTRAEYESARAALRADGRLPEESK